MGEKLTNVKRKLQKKEDSTPEYRLVIYMLIVLFFLVVAVLWIPQGEIPSNESDFRYTDLLDYRKSILSLILTAFGAWIGAGAAYFFGRENLREAANSLLQMREQSPRERLRATQVRDIPLRPIDWVVKTSDELKVVSEKLKKETNRWYIPIVQDDGALKTIIHEEGIWRFVDKLSEDGKPYNEIMQSKILDVLAYIDDVTELLRVKDIYITTTLEKSAGDTYELMQNKGVYLAVITDDKGKPTNYFDTADVRRVLLQLI